MVLMACVAVLWLPHGRHPLVGGVSNFDLLDQASTAETQELASAFCIPSTDKKCTKCKSDCHKAAEKRKEKGITPPYKWKYNADAKGNGCTCTVTGSSGKAEVVFGDVLKKLQQPKIDAHLLAQTRTQTKPASGESSQEFIGRVLRRAKHMKDLAGVSKDLDG